MINDAFENFQYNSCVSRGICSLSPKNTALQTVLVLYLRVFSSFAKKLNISAEQKMFFLEVLSSSLYNPDFNEDTFLIITQNFKEELVKLSIDFSEKFTDIEIENENKKAEELFNNTKDVVQAIKFGEIIFKKTLDNIPAEIRDIYNILLFIAKSLSINTLDLFSFGKFHDKAFSLIVDILYLINLNERNLDILKEKIILSAELDIQLIQDINSAQEKRYGKQEISEVSYSTYPNNAVLVVGSNIRELEEVLENLKSENIDIYTHDDMMISYTFPKFKTYQNLKGQFGLGLENCLLDFATFPGPIILTKHSLHNVENFYRGLLFTTDYTYPKGIIKIKNNDYNEVIKSAYNSKGFKHGKLCESVMIGYVYEETISKILDMIHSKKYRNLFFIANAGYSLEQKNYFEKLIRSAPKDTLVISFSYNFERENLIHINTCFDYFGMIKIFEGLKELDLAKTIFFPVCEKYSVSEMIYFSAQPDTKVYVGKCAPIILNPSLINTLDKIFQISSITTAKKDLDIIFKDK